MPGIKIDILGDKELEAKLSRMPVEVADLAMGGVEDYLLNVMRNDQPSPTFITRKAAYGKSYFSEAQRRFLGWLHSEGKVPHHRTQELARGWHIVKRGLFGYLVNYVKGASYVVGERNQSRHEKLVGWLKPSEQIAKRRDKINAIIDGAAKKALKRLGLK